MIIGTYQKTVYTFVVQQNNTLLWSLLKTQKTLALSAHGMFREKISYTTDSLHTIKCPNRHKRIWMKVKSKWRILQQEMNCLAYKFAFIVNPWCDISFSTWGTRWENMGLKWKCCFFPKSISWFLLDSSGRAGYERADTAKWPCIVLFRPTKSVNSFTVSYKEAPGIISSTDDALKSQEKQSSRAHEIKDSTIQMNLFNDESRAKFMQQQKTRKRTEHVWTLEGNLI